MQNKLFKSFYREVENKTPYNTAAISISYEVMKVEVPADTVFSQLRKGLQNQITTEEKIDYSDDKIQGLPTRVFRRNFSINEFKLTSIITYFIDKNVLFCYNATVSRTNLKAIKRRLKPFQTASKLTN
jgi:hypothetical protein